MTSSLLGSVRTLLAGIEESLSGEHRAAVSSLRNRLDEPLRVAIAGRLKAGKSTLLNALVGEELAATNAGESTRIMTWYRNGPTYRATFFPVSGHAHQVMLSRTPVPLAEHEPRLNGTRIERVVVEWPSNALRDLTLIDTPGLDSSSEDVSTTTLRLTDPDSEAEADAVLYLLQHVHPSDVQFLDAFHSHSHLGALNAIGILSRADEVAPGHFDALEIAQQVARRHERHPTIRRLCQSVIPVAGLLAQAGATMTETQFNHLALLAALPGEHRANLLRSVDRFSADDADEPVPGSTRRELLAKMGLFGTRLGIHLIHRGEVVTAADLAREFADRSGIETLRTAIRTGLAQRQDVFKSSVAIAGVRRVLAGFQASGAQALAARVEQFVAGAHEFAEANALGLIRSGVSLPEELMEEAERLLGGSGQSLRARLGLHPEHPEAELPQLIRGAINRWRRHAEHPLSTPDSANLARVVVRSYEGLLGRPEP